MELKHCNQYTIAISILNWSTDPCKYESKLLANYNQMLQVLCVNYVVYLKAAQTTSGGVTKHNKDFARSDSLVSYTDKNINY